MTCLQHAVEKKQKHQHQNGAVAYRSGLERPYLLNVILKPTEALDAMRISAGDQIQPVQTSGASQFSPNPGRKDHGVKSVRTTMNVWESRNLIMEISSTQARSRAAKITMTLIGNKKFNAKTMVTKALDQLKDTELKNDNPTL